MKEARHKENTLFDAIYMNGEVDREAQGRLNHGVAKKSDRLYLLNKIVRWQH